MADLYFVFRNHVDWGQVEPLFLQSHRDWINMLGSQMRTHIHIHTYSNLNYRHHITYTYMSESKRGWNGMDVLLTATITCDVITQNSGGDDTPERGELSFQVLLGERLREAAHVQVSTLDGFAARTGIRHLQHTNHTDSNN